MDNLKIWLPLAIAITLISGLAYVISQQSIRLSANDPQIQLAEDTVHTLESGQTPDMAIPKETVNLRQSLAPFVIIYDSTGTVLASSGSLDGQPPTPPVGVLSYAQTHGENRITWQPDPNVREAIVIRPYQAVSNGFVLAGRSLREVEKREWKLEQLTLMGWLFALAASLFTLFLIQIFGSTKNR